MKKIWLAAIIFTFLAVLLGVLWVFLRNDRSEDELPSPAVEAGRQLSNNKCSGEGPGTLTNLPMGFKDFAIIIPYGLMVGDHVTPVDHQYYSPTVFNSPRDKYPVYAMADSRLVEVQPRDTERGREYRMVFSVTCTFLYYYDLVTSLSPEIQSAYENRVSVGLDLEVKAGQLIGRIGGQTLDFAVWDTQTSLTGFINPDGYQRAEGWKIYTADPLNYVTQEIKDKMLSKYIRVVEPRSGKIDYDVDGRLIGTWFLEGTGGYGGPSGTDSNYWKGHLSIVPEHIDPSAFIFSVGDYRGFPQQFSLPRSAKNPVEVSVASGLVKYALIGWQYLEGNTGRYWDRMSFPSAFPLTLVNSGFPTQGCVLVQLVEDRRLKMEAFPNKVCSAAPAFTSAAKFYER